MEMNDEIMIEKVWGGRELERLFGKKLPKGKFIGECWVFYKKHYPVVLKLIDVEKPLSVQVHPYGKDGKSELWYIIKADKTTKVLGGMDLKSYNVKAGDWVYLPGGTVHTILPPAVILEVSQNNLSTYRLYDWGRRSRKLDIEEGIKNIIINAKPVIYRGIDTFNCPYFRIELKKGRNFRINGIFFVMDGIVKAGKRIIKKGEALLVNGNVYPLTKAVVFSVSWITKSSKTRFSGIV